VDDGEVLEVPGDDEEVDEVLRDEGMSNVRLACSCSSYNGEEGWLERSPLR
jgi:hypothetical protein